MAATWYKGLLCSLLLAIGAVIAGPAPAAADDEAEYREQRERFQEAWKRLVSGREVDLAAVTSRLGDYPLVPYLHYRDLRNRLDNARAAEVQAYLDRYDLPVNGFLRRAWLHQRADAGDWQGFIAAYDPGQTDTALECHYLEAQARTIGLDTHWLDEARALWTVGHSQPDTCDPVFDRLYERGVLRSDDAWARIDKAMENGELGLARFIARRLLSGDERALFDAWARLHEQPERLLDDPTIPSGGERGRTILAHALTRLGIRDPDEGWAALQQVAEEGPLSQERVHELARHIALRAAYGHRDSAADYLDRLPAAAVDDEVRLWRARVALGREDWRGLQRAIADLPAEEGARDTWRYWDARADLALGRLQEGQQALAELAERRSYYGFLAADHGLHDYPLPRRGTRQPAASLAAIEALADHPGLKRAHEFFRLGMWPEARREWREALTRLPPPEQEAAAELAHRWGWHDRAIFTAHQAGLHDAVDLRFPTPFRDRVEYHAREAGLDPAFVFAIIRKESAFMQDARSHAGALGLMQVMPATGRAVSRRQGRALPSTYSLLDPEVSLRVGTAYLAEMLARYDGNPVLAAAAYNAGPRHVDRWFEAAPDASPDVWVERITFRETRGYVKDVLAWTSIFSWQLGREPVRVASMMRGGALFAELDDEG
ncbi:transglycosylase SLT domain-containing protein [Alkalilimnicola ehrlichii MLHE-1]|uniref:Lytic transglycosylase, catalytic n=1 Tax=Alkalilimnicola ehrlichii (strain ATCC BAA-1101 / DSM 17681 / MLHE-1) TaxID=187272 RepID=Q0A8W0_ALKEH|nr:transglycosylase SLT domain-containing protein [Alkalilimnicola ehrlichii]ABI56727.1 Lytic transglycosylase, catalytic [Alkalilimnicola ehrlichii MLHE-1]